MKANNQIYLFNFGFALVAMLWLSRRQCRFNLDLALMSLKNTPYEPTNPQTKKQTKRKGDIYCT